MRNKCGKLLETYEKALFMTQPKPEPFGFVTFSLALLHNNFFVKWFIMTVCTAVCLFTATQHISQRCGAEGKWFEISFWQYLWEMRIYSHLITSLFFSWVLPSNQASGAWPQGSVKPWKETKWTTPICPLQVRLKAACQQSDEWLDETSLQEALKIWRP